MGALIGRDRRAGVTLVELMVVLAIVMVVLGLTVAAVRVSRQKADQAVCASNLRQLVTAIRMYAADNDGMGPPYTTAYVPYYDRFYANGQLFRSLEPYLKSTQLWFCPSDPLRRRHFADRVDHSKTSYYVENSEAILETDDPSRERVAWDARWYGAPDRLWHLRGYNQAYADGHVRWLCNALAWDPYEEPKPIRDSP